VLGASLLGACASADAPKSYSEGVADACYGACVGWQRCQLADASCYSACIASYDPRGIRSESLTAVGQCLETETCATLDSEEAFGPCFDKVRESEPLRDQLVVYCEAAAAGYFDCNVWWPVEDCAHTMGVWNDDVLRAATRCFGRKDCDAREACENDVFENPL